jgi:two-component system alkaline phosphatase synthesis response regulator PhoP
MLVLGKTILVQGGVAVETALDSVEGLEKRQAGRDDRIVLDVMMPRMDDYEAAKPIRKLEEHKTTPIVRVTASTDRRAITQGFRSDVVVFMNKPFTAKKFLAVIQTIIR